MRKAPATETALARDLLGGNEDAVALKAAVRLEQIWRNGGASGGNAMRVEWRRCGDSGDGDYDGGDRYFLNF